MEKIIGYIRYSSHAQDDGNSVAAQTTCIEQYATAHDMEIEKFYMDTAKSGRFTENRPEYNRMKEEIQNGTIQAKTIVVRALDRLHRNAAHQLEDLTFFEKQNIRLIASHRRYRYTTAQNQKILRAGEILTKRKHNTSRFPTACRQLFLKKISKKHKRTCGRMQPNRPIEPERTTML